MLAKAAAGRGRALLKYGYSKFTLEILEYCDSSEIIFREQYGIILIYYYQNIIFYL